MDLAIDNFIWKNQQLYYCTGDKNTTQITVDLGEELARLSRQRLGVKKDLLSRALGLDKEPQLKIVDGTMGLAKDTAHLLHFGARVQGVERDPLVWLLVADAYRRLPDPMRENFFIYNMSIQTFLAKGFAQASVLYLDPMFMDGRKKALPKKGMAFLRSRQDHGSDLTATFDVAWQRSFTRIVVKRPINGPPLAGVPSYSLTGNLVRFDVYLAAGFPDSSN